MSKHHRPGTRNKSNGRTRAFLRSRTRNSKPSIDNTLHVNKAATRTERQWRDLDEHRFWQFARMELAVRKQQTRQRLASRDGLASTVTRVSAQGNKRRDTSLGTRLARFLSGIGQSLRPAHVAAAIVRAPKRLTRNPLMARQRRNSKKANSNPRDTHRHPMGIRDSRKLKKRFAQLERRFRKQMDLAAKLFLSYHYWIEKLPPEDIDDEIKALRQRYIQIGRQREWYFAFRMMAEEIVRESTGNGEGTGRNEPTARVLQEDFLQTMESRFATYWRLHELRAYCYKHKLSGAISDIQRLSSNLPAGDDLLRAPVDYSEIESLVAMLEERIRNIRRAEARRAQSSKPKKQVLDHSKRREEWERFVELVNGHFPSVNTMLGDLKHIVSYNKGWQLEYQVFRSMTRAKRIERSRKGQPATVREDTMNFVRTMAERINRELDTDLAFEQAKQADTAQMDASLQDAIIRIQLELSQRGTGALDDIHQIKQTYLANRETNPEGNIVPLFSQR